MISQFLFPIFCIVCAVLAWGAYCLPFALRLKIVFFVLAFFGLAYIVPIGPFADPAAYLPYPVLVCLALVCAFSFFYFWAKVMHLCIAFVFALPSIIFNTLRPKAKKFFLSHKINAGIAILCVFCSFFSVYSTLRVPDVKYTTLYYPNLPAELESYTIAQITDTHIGNLFPKEWNERVAEKIMAEKPNLIVHTGDIGDEKPQDIAKHLAPFEKLSAPDGVYFVFGNHENYHVLSHWQNYFQKHGLHVLENECVLIRDSLAVAGAKSQPHYSSLDTDTLLKNIPEHVFTIFLDHYPRRFLESAPFIDLQLSGHTHGGTVFFLAPLVAKFNGGFISGTYEQDNAKLYVSNGTGIWTYSAFRLFVPSEIAIIKLQGKK